MMVKKDIRNISAEELEEFFLEHKQKPFVARQVIEWIWKKSVTSFSEMKNISKENRKLLDDNFVINTIHVDSIQISKDRTIKTRFKLFDNHTIEGVLIPQNKRMTACISSQVGCSLSCKFCATGTIDRKRNLSAGEMCVVPKGIEHKPCAKNECKILVIEPRGVINTGDAGGELTINEEQWV